MPKQCSLDALDRLRVHLNIILFLLRIHRSSVSWLCRGVSSIAGVECFHVDIVIVLLCSPCKYINRTNVTFFVHHGT